MKTKSLSAVLFSIIAFSCTLIKDDDITEPGQLDNTFLSQIFVSSENQDGISDIGIGTFTYGTDQFGQSSIDITWTGDFGPQSDFRFRGLAGSNNINSVLTQLKVNNQNQIVDAFVFGSNDNQAKETYHFTYDSEGRVVFISWGIFDTNENGSDSIIYQAGTNRIDHVKRMPEFPTNSQVVLVKYGPVLGSNEIRAEDIATYEYPSGTNVPSDIFDLSNPWEPLQALADPRRVFFAEGGHTSDGLAFWFARPEDNLTPANTFFGSMIVRITELSGDIDKQVFLHDSRVDEQSNNFFGSENKLPNIVYYHPFTLFPDLFPEGKDLAMIFMEDWWIISQSEDPSFFFSANRRVNIDYTRQFSN